MTTLFDRIGGQPALEAAVFLFYEKTLKDERIAHYFDGVDVQVQQSKMLGFMKQAFGGAHEHTSFDLRRAHAGLSLSEDDFNAVAENLIDTLTELEIPKNLQDETLSIIATTKDDVLCRKAV